MKKSIIVAFGYLLLASFLPLVCGITDFYRNHTFNGFIVGLTVDGLMVAAGLILTAIIYCITYTS
jgi:hypothetical protein